MLKGVFSRSEEGQAVVEYAAIVGLMVLALFAAVMFFGIGVSNLYSSITSAI